MLESRVEHVLAMAGRFHPGIEHGLCTALPRRHILCCWPTDTSLPQPRDETVTPADAVTDLAITRHALCLIERGLLELGIRRHQRQSVCLANSIENRGGIVVTCCQRRLPRHCRHRQRSSGKDKKATPVKYKSLFLLHCLPELSNY